MESSLGGESLEVDSSRRVGGNRERDTPKEASSNLCVACKAALAASVSS